MPGFKLSPAAKKDLQEIGRYTSRQWGRRQRNEYLTELNSALEKLSNNPGLGRNRFEIEANLYSFPIGSRQLHIAYYRRIPSGIEIARILHHKMDSELQFERLK